MALQLQLNEPQKVLVTHVTENGKIFLQLDTEDAYSLPELSQNIEKAVAQNPSPLPSPQPGQQCCAFSTNDQIWYRAMVTSSQGSEVGVYYVDYGSTESIPLEQISAPGCEFFKMPYQSICCRLSDFIPRGGKWDSEVITFLTASLVEQELMAVFKSASAEKHPFPLSGETCYDVILSDVETGKTSITEALVGNQLGQFSIRAMRIEVGSSVKAGVCFVNSPGKFWIQLDQSSSALEDLMSDLNDESTVTTLTPLPPSHLSPGVACCCAFSEDGMIYRAEIIEFTSQTKARVSYTDYGNNGVVELANIFALPSRFSKLEALAVQCCLEGVKPVRHSKPDPLKGTIAWRPDACSHFEELATETSFDIRFVTELSPEVYSVNIADVTGKSIGKSLADSGFAELRVSDPPERNADQTPAVRQKQQSTPLKKEIETSPSDFNRETLSPGETFKTLISYAESPSIVWCQRVSTQREFEKMMELLDKSVSKFPAVTDFKPSLPCCALYGPDKTWCRASILEVNASTKQVLVSFVDYGNSDVIPFSNVRQLLSTELFTLPVQAMCCSIADISPRGGAEWSQEAILAFQEIAANRQLICEVVNVEKEDLPTVKFSDSVMDNRDVGMELVRRGYAKAPLSPPRSHSHVPVPPRSVAKLPPHDEPSNEEEYFTTSSFKLTYNKLKLAPAHIFDVTVSHVESFLEFYCQLQSDSDKLASLMDKIEVHCNSLEAVQCSTLNVGTPVLAQFSADGGWYRALINARPRSGGVCPLTFVDYGNSEDVEVANILQIPSKFISLPTQAFKCQLYGVSPDHQPTDSDIEAFSAYVLEQNFRLFARSHDKSTNEFTVELQTFEKVSVLKILIEDGSITPPKLLVSASLSPRIPDTPPVSSPRNQESKEPPKKASPQQPKPVVPLPRLPTGTFVDVVVSYWESPSKFHVQLTQSYAQLEQLSTDIKECYEHGSSSLVKPIEGDFCAAKFSEDDLWYRARVVKLTGRDAEISFIDYGNCAVVDVSSLKVLKPEFAPPPCVAVPVYLEGVDDSVADSEAVIEQFSSLVTNCVLVGKFSKSLSDYDGPVPILLMDTTKPGSDVNIADVLSSSSSIPAETEPRQPRNGIEIPMVTPVLNSPMEATVSYVVNPSEFYCQLSSETTPLESLMNKMYARYEEQSPGAPLISPSGGEYCAVPFSDGSWYRGRVVKIGPPPAESVTVDYIDYGNTEVLEVASLKVLEPEFTSLPVQALKCRLADLQSPSHAEWNGDAIEKFEEAVIEQQVSAIFQEDLGNGCYDVQLQVLGNDISQRLIEAGLARRGLMESGTSGTQSVGNERNIAIPALELTQGMRFDIFVTSVVSVKEFYCQILDPEEKLDVLMTDIADHCSVEGNSKTPSPHQLKPGDFILAQFSVDEGWYRAKIDKILKNGQSFEVFYVDYGNSEIVTPDRIRVIESRFCQLPVQAVKCSLEGAQYYVFSDEASVSFSDAILNAECEMICEAIIGEYCGVSLARKGDGIDVMAFAIQQGMLQPVVTKKSTVDVSSPTQKTTKSPQPSQHSSSSNKTSTDFSTKVSVKSSQSDASSLRTIFPEFSESSYHDVTVSHVETPSLFFCQFSLDQKERLEAMMSEMQAFYNSGKCPDYPGEIDPGCFLIGRYAADGIWYRVQVSQVLELEKYEVCFVDYGNTDVLCHDFHTKDLRPLQTEYAKLPALAIPCSMADIEPPEVGVNWSEAAVEKFSELVLEKNLIVRVKSPQDLSKKPFCFSEDITLSVEFVGGSEGGRSVAAELVASGLARWSDVDALTPSQPHTPTPPPPSQPHTPTPPPPSQPSDGTLVTASLPSHLQPLTPPLPSHPHTLTPSQLPTPPRLSKGETYHVYIPSTDSPKQFHCQLCTESEKLELLMSSIADYYSVNQPPFGDVIAPGCYCMAQYSGNEAWYRAKVLEISDKGVNVQFVDFGNCQVLPPTSEILALAPQFAKLPVQMLSCSLVKDLSVDFTEELLEAFFSLDLNEDFRVKVSDIFFDQSDGEIRYVVELFDSDGILVEFDLPDQEEEELPETDLAMMSQSTNENAYVPLTYPPGSKFSAYLSYLHSPTSFYCQPLELTAVLDEMMSSISKTMATYTTSEGKVPFPNISPGLVCLAQFSEDDEWYRALVEEVTNENEAIVTFVDYGNSEELSFSKLAPISKNFLRTPLQAVHCSVCHGMGPELEWNDNQVSCFRNLIPEDDFTLLVNGVSDNGQHFVNVLANDDVIDISTILELSEAIPGISLEDPTNQIEDVPEEIALTNQISLEDMDKFRPIMSLQKPLKTDYEGGTNLSTLALKGSKSPSSGLEESENGNQTSESESDNASEGKPLIRAPFKLTLNTGEVLEVSVVHCQSPSVLFVQRLDCQSELEKLSLEMSQFCSSFADTQQQFSQAFHSGDYVLARYPLDEQWYRAEVLAVNDNEQETVEVSFIDFGNIEQISSKNVIMCPENFLELPAQGIQCSLAQVPSRDSWPESYKELMEDLVTDSVFKASVLVPASQGMRCIISLEERESGRDVAQQILGRLQEECEAFGVGDLLLVAGLPEGVSPSNSGGEGAVAAMGESPTGGEEGEKGEIPVEAEEEGESPVIEAERGGGGGGESRVDQGDSPVGDVESPVVLVVVEEGKPLEDAGGSPVEGEANERPEEETPSNEGETPGNEEEAPSNEGETPGNEEEAPSNEGEAPGNEEEAPSNEGEAPSNEGEAPSNEGEAPSKEEEEDPEGESPITTETPVKEERTPTEAEATTDRGVTTATSTTSGSEDKDDTATEATERGTAQANATIDRVTSESEAATERMTTESEAATERVTSESEVTVEGDTTEGETGVKATERDTTQAHATTERVTSESEAATERVSSESEDKDDIAIEATERGTTQASATTEDVTSESEDIAIEGLERGTTQANATIERGTTESEVSVEGATTEGEGGVKATERDSAQASATTEHVTSESEDKDETATEATDRVTTQASATTEDVTSESEDKDETATEATDRVTTQASATTEDVTRESEDIAIEGLEHGTTQANATTERVTTESEATTERVSSESEDTEHVTSGSEDKDDIATEATERGTTDSETTTAVQTEHKMVSITSTVEGTMRSPSPQLLSSVAATHSKPELPVRELVIGTSHDAIITSISTPHSFVCQLASDTTAIESVQSLLSTLSLPPLETPPREGDIVCGVFSTDQALYRRAKVISVEEGGKRFEILFVDFGNTEVVSLADLRGMKEEGGVDLCGFPALAWECFLTGVELPSDSGVFDDSAAAKMLDLIGEDPVTMEIVTVDSAGHLGVKLTTSKGVNVGESLIEENLASPLVDSFLTTPSTATQPTPDTSLLDQTPFQDSQDCIPEDPIPMSSETPVDTEKLIEEPPEVESTDDITTTVPFQDSHSDSEVPVPLQEDALQSAITTYPQIAVGSQFHVSIPRVTSLDDFLCVISDKDNALKTVMDEMASQNYSIGIDEFSLVEPKPGLPVCACSKTNDKWYRSRITGTGPSLDSFRVFHVDTGVSEQLSVQRLKRLEQRFASSLPAQVIRCSLPPLLESDLNPALEVQGEPWELMWPPSCVQTFSSLITEQGGLQLEQGGGLQLELLQSSDEEEGVCVVKITNGDVDLREQLVAKLREPKPLMLLDSNDSESSAELELVPVDAGMEQGLVEGETEPAFEDAGMESSDEPTPPVEGGMELRLQPDVEPGREDVGMESTLEATSDVQADSGSGSTPGTDDGAEGVKEAVDDDGGVKEKQPDETEGLTADPAPVEKELLSKQDSSESEDTWVDALENGNVETNPVESKSGNGNAEMSQLVSED